MNGYNREVLVDDRILDGGCCVQKVQAKMFTVLSKQSDTGNSQTPGCKSDSHVEFNCISKEVGQTFRKKALFKKKKA